MSNAHFIPTKEPEEYLRLAQNAEEAAAEAQSIVAKNSFYVIAQECRYLAAKKFRLKENAETP